MSQFAHTVSILANPSFSRRPCARRKCAENLPEDRAQRPAVRLRHLLRVLCPARVHGRQVGLRARLWLVLELDRHRRPPHLVRHLIHVHPLLQGHAGAGLRPQDAAVRVLVAAIRRILLRDRVYYHLLRKSGIALSVCARH